MFAGGQGAPLVPLLDYVLFADTKRGRVLQNIGGIANLTAIPAGATPAAVIAFDTGPGNMIIDALTQQLFNKPFDRNGALAARGRVLEPVLASRAAQSLLPSQASPHRGPRTVRPRIRRRISSPTAESSAPRPKTQSRPPPRSPPNPSREAIERFVLPAHENPRRRLHRLRRRRAQPHPDGPARRTVLSRSAASSPPAPHSASPSKPKKPPPSLFSPGKPGITCPAMFPSATGAARPVILGQVTYV